MSSSSPATTGHAAWWRAHPPRHLADVARHNAEHTPDRRVFSRRVGDEWRRVSALEFWQQVQGLAKGLLAKGVQPGERVAVMSGTRYEWQLLDVAVWAAGGVVVPIEDSATPTQVHWVLTDSGCAAAFLETAAHQELVESLGSRLPDLRDVWIINHGSGSASLDALITAGSGVDDAALDRRLSGLSPSSLATIVYTSGTTDRPKGCMLPHGALLASAQCALDALEEVFDASASALLFLPFSHILARSVSVALMLGAVHTGHSNLSRVDEDLSTFSPTMIVAVPDVLARFRASARRAAGEAGRRKVFDKAEAVALAYSEQLDTPAWQRRLTGSTTSLAHRGYRKPVYDPVTRQLGGNLRWIVCGGAPLDPDLLHFFRGIGFTVLEGYGLTETAGACAVNPPGAVRVGTVGPVMPGAEVRTDDVHEIQVRSVAVFDGYWNDDAASAASFTADGWYRTGDVGYVEDGYLSIAGRLADALTTARGRVVHPAHLEEVVRGCQFVSHCVLVGEGRDHVAALITLDPDVMGEFTRAHGLEHEPWEAVHDHPDLQTDLRLFVSKANALVPPEDRIHTFRILPGSFTEESGHLTSAGKLRRSVIHRDFARDIDSLY